VGIVLRGQWLRAVLLVAVTPNVRAAGEPAIDLAKARQYFAEAQALAAGDAGKLWGVSLAGPLLFVDPTSRMVVASQADAVGRLTLQEGVFVGTLPPEEVIAGTAMTWSGVRWAMFPWPLPEDPRERRRLLAHESWHRVQEQAGFPAANPVNGHLDTREGRVWMQLEWRALVTALRGDGDARRQAITDALIFRACRRSLFPEAADSERAMEMHEGLAEYTGVRLGGETPAAVREMTLSNHAASRSWPTLVFSFAYVSGPSYGLLLDEFRPAWRSGLTPQQDLGRLLQDALLLTLPGDLKGAAQERAAAYDGEQLMAAEAERERSAQDQRGRDRRRLVEGPVLVIRIQSMRFQFDPRDVQVLDDVGKVYPKMRMTDAWGVLEVTGGALIASDWSSVTVPASADITARPLAGDGWTLDLKPGWTVRPGKRPGDQVVEQEHENP